MRVLFLLTANGFGLVGSAGTYKVIEHVAKRHDVLVVEVVYIREALKHLIVFKDESIPKVNLFNKDFKEMSFNVWKEIKRFSPDIVHTYRSGNTLKFAKALRHLHDCSWILDLKSPILFQGKMRRRQRVENFFLQTYIDHILTSSKFTYRSNVPIRYRRSTFVPLGVDVRSVNRKKYENNHLIRNFVYIGSIHTKRKIEFLCNAFCEAADRIDADITLTLFGQGDAVEYVKDFSKGKGASKIFFKGLLPYNEMLHTMASFDAGIAYVPDDGNFNESPSLKSIEIPAAGLPVLVSDTKAHRDYAKKFKFSYLFFKNSTNGLTKALNEVVESGFPNKWIDNNIKQIKQLDYANIVDNYILPVYQSVAQ